jgi:hypothetical protein
MIKFLELALSQEVYEYLEELDQMKWSARGNVLNQYLRNISIGTTVIKGIWQYKLSLSYLKKAFKMIYKLLLQLFRILLGFRNKSTYFDQKQRAFRHLGHAFDMRTSQVG